VSGEPVKHCAWPGVCFFKVPSKPVYYHKSISNFQIICLKFSSPAHFQTSKYNTWLHGCRCELHCKH